MNLVLVRHGESIWNKNNLFTGWTDVDLSEKGKEEAKTAGRALKEAGFDFDICYTSCLKRAIYTLEYILREMQREELPIIRTWKLNERHYGALQGLNKEETASKYGASQVKLWRRSLNERPPMLDEYDERNPRLQEKYLKEDLGDLVLGESLKDTIGRVIPYFENTIRKEMEKNKRVLIVAHGNSLRALVQYFEKLSEKEIVDVEIPTGVPVSYEFDDGFNFIGKKFID